MGRGNRALALVGGADPEDALDVGQFGLAAQPPRDRHEVLDEVGERVYCAGVARDDDGRLVTAGGRVLAVTALADTIAAARDAAYEAIAHLSWRGMQYRSDIAELAAKEEVA